MNVKKLVYNDNAYPAVLRDISSPPKQLFYIGADPKSWVARPRVAIVGSRGVSAYGRAVTIQLAHQLAEKGITIISGLALGVDAIAHEAAVSAGGAHIAVLPVGLDRIYPASNRSLAERILTRGGVLVSEYEGGQGGMKHDFIARNRIVAGLADVVVITEASEKSGTLHTARFALEQGREVGVVPGNITSPNSVGANNLIKSGASPITCVEDILHLLGADNLAEARYVHRGETDDEQALLDLLYRGLSDGYGLLEQSGMSAECFTQTLTMLELAGKVRPLGNNHWAPR